MRKRSMDMDPETADLKALFEAADAPLNEAAFTGAVMQRVSQARRQRRLLLIVAGALGAAIAVTQLPTLLSLIAAYSAPVNELASAITKDTAPSSAYGLLRDPPMWMIALAMAMAASAAALMPTETA